MLNIIISILNSCYDNYLFPLTLHNPVINMKKIKIHGGDFRTNGSFSLGTFILSPNGKFMSERISVKELETLEIATEENVKKLGGAIGWGIAGGVLFGPVGLLAGALLGGRKKETTFVAKFKDGRKILGTTDHKTFVNIKGKSGLF